MRVTMEYIAAMSGVSKATVSRVVNGATEGVGEETRKRVQAVIDKLNYNVSGIGVNHNQTRTKTLGVIIPDICNPFFPELIKAVEACASQHNYTVLFGNTDCSIEKELSYLSTFIAKQVDGIILTSTSDNVSQLYHNLKKSHVPCVLLDRDVGQIEYGAGVFVDNEFATFTGCEYLIKHGNENIAFLSGPKDISTSEERMQGYRVALIQYNLPFQEELVRYGDYSVQSGYDCIMDLHQSGVPFTGVIASNDAMAIGALRALKKLKYKIPEEVELIGFDNIYFAELTEPPLTTVRQPISEVGRVATQLLLNLIENVEIPNKRIRLQPSLVVRGTTREEK